MRSFNLDSVNQMLAEFGRRSPYWFRKGTYASLTKEAWETEYLSLPKPRLSYMKNERLIKIRNEVVLYFARPWPIRMLQWLFTDIGIKANMFIFHECVGVLQYFSVIEGKRLSSKENQALNYFVNPALDSYVDRHCVRTIPMAWFIQRLSSNSSLKPVLSQLVQVAQSVLEEERRLPAAARASDTSDPDCSSGSPFFSGWGSEFAARALPSASAEPRIMGVDDTESIKSSLSYRDSCYESLGAGVTADTTIPQLTKAFRKASLKSHPDKGGTTDAFSKLQKAYYFAVYMRVHDRKETDEMDILKVLNKGELAEFRKHKEYIEKAALRATARPPTYG